MNNKIKSKKNLSAYLRALEASKRVKGSPEYLERVLRGKKPLKPVKKVDPRVLDIDQKIEEAKTQLRIHKDEKRKLLKQIEKEKGRG